MEFRILRILEIISLFFFFPRDFSTIRESTSESMEKDRSFQISDCKVSLSREEKFLISEESNDWTKLSGKMIVLSKTTYKKKI